MLNIFAQVTVNAIFTETMGHKMGMFDSVDIICPHCGKETECQTKSGPCMLRRYTLDNAPISVAAGIVGQNWCDQCKQPFVIELTTKPVFRVIKGESENDPS